jgi:filamentous hemagglutinin
MTSNPEKYGRVTPNPITDITEQIVQQTPGASASLWLTWLGADERVLAPTRGGGTVRVFRVEGTPNTRVLIGDAGEVAIVDASKSLFLNFGSRARAEQYLAQKLAKGLPGAEVKSFEVPKSFVDELRASAVPEALAGQNPGKPLIVDVTKAADQLGLRPEQIEALKKVIIQGTGRTGLD